MSKILRGTDAASALTEKLTARAAALKAAGITPCLAIVRVGDKDDDIAYERAAVKRCGKIGIAVRNVLLHDNVPQEVLIYEIDKLNNDNNVHGVLLLRPLPKHIDEAMVCEELAPSKDVDGITMGSLAAVYAGRGEGYAPCTAASCIEILKHYGIPMSGKHAVVIGRSLVIGKPVSQLLLAENATVTTCHSRTEHLQDICRSADIIIAAAGKAGMVDSDYVKPGQTVLDVGIHVDADGNMCGDAAQAEIEPIVDALSPVPGGVGAVTTAILASHVIEAAEKATRSI